MKLNDIISGLNCKKIIGKTNLVISGIAYDSRKCKNNYIFCALRGTLSEGHNYIDSAIINGSTVIICEELPAILNKDIVYILVENTRKALSTISHNYYGNPSSKLTIIGVTGTNGKTTITYLLKSIFEENGDVVGIIGTTGILIGDEKLPATHTTPESLELCGYFALMADKGVSKVIMEVSSHALSQYRVDNIDFNTAVFTNLTQDHLDYHHDMNDYAKAKKKLFDLMKPESKAILFDNSEYSKYLVKDCKSEIIEFIGRTEYSDFKIHNEKLGLGDSSFEISINGNSEIKIHTILSGRFNIDNAAIAAAIAIINEVKLEVIIKGLSKTNGAPGRMQQIKLINGALAIVDYAHTPDALEKALTACREVLNSNNRPGKLICVFGCGGDRDKTKRPLMGRIAASFSDFTVITSDNPRNEAPEIIIEEIIGGFSEINQNYITYIKRSEGILFACNISKENDIILIAGKGHENYQIIGEKKAHFDDIEELIKWNNKNI